MILDHEANSSQDLDPLLIKGILDHLLQSLWLLEDKFGVLLRLLMQVLRLHYANALVALPRFWEFIDLSTQLL